MSKVEKDIIQASSELDLNKDIDEIHKEQNPVENLSIGNVDSEASGTNDALEKVESIFDKLEDEDSIGSSNEINKSEPIDSSPTKEQNVIDENITEDVFSEVYTFHANEEGLDDIVTEESSEKEATTEVKEIDEQKNHKELSFDEIVRKILTKEIKTNKDFGRVIEGRWAFKRGKTDHDLIPAIKAGK